MPRLIDFTDEELANALHFIEGHEEDLESEELIEWRYVKKLILLIAAAAQLKEVEKA